MKLLRRCALLGARYAPPLVRSSLARFALKIGLCSPRHALYFALGAPEVILGGPFHGVRYSAEACGSALMPKLLGTYELEVSAILQKLGDSHFASLVDVGAAEGYYVAGLGVSMGIPELVAFETSEHARRVLARIVQANFLSDKVQISGLCDHRSLEQALQAVTRPTLVICDIDGPEVDLLEPSFVPTLQDVTLVIECHDPPGSDRAIRKSLMARFATSHDIQLIAAVPRSVTDFPLAKVFPESWICDGLDEFRPYQQEWLVMTPNLLRDA